MSGVMQLGYLGFEVSAPDVWRAFAQGTLGLALGESFENGGFSLRMDSHPQRFFVEQGPLDDAAFVGWQVADRAALEQIAARLPSFTRGTAEECARRHVAGLIKFEDPSGMPGELLAASNRNGEAAPGLVGFSEPKVSSFFTSCRCRQRGHWARTPLSVTNLSSMA